MVERLFGPAEREFFDAQQRRRRERARSHRAPETATDVAAIEDPVAVGPPPAADALSVAFRTEPHEAAPPTEDLTMLIGPAPPAVRFLLRVIDGEAMDTTFPLPPGVSSIGRDHDNDITLADNAVSRHHAALIVREDRVMIEDAGSRNGTAVNGEDIDGPVDLSVGDIVEIGMDQLRLEHTGEPGRE
jgi:FHA domain